MRISGFGTGSGGSQGQGGNRSDNFRKRHRLGQKIRGSLLKNLPDSMAWVEIDGIHLLAQLEVAHPEGSRLLFLIQQLTPDIILKELSGDQAGKTSALGLASAFDTARTLFEHRFQDRLREHGRAGLPLSVEDFLALLARHPELYAAYMDAAGCAQTISTVLAASRKGRILYQPWLATDGLRQATFINQGDESAQLSEIIIEFDHLVMGLVRVQFLHKRTTLACKLKIQHPENETALQQYLVTRLHPGIPLDIQFLGTAKLPRSSHCGIIAETLFKP